MSTQGPSEERPLNSPHLLHQDNNCGKEWKCRSYFKKQWGPQKQGKESCNTFPEMLDNCIRESMLYNHNLDAGPVLRTFKK